MAKLNLKSERDVNLICGLRAERRLRGTSERVSPPESSLRHSSDITVRNGAGRWGTLRVHA